MEQMGYSIELYLESGFEEKLRSLWDDLEKAGVPSILQKIGSRPHLSLLNTRGLSKAVGHWKNMDHGCWFHRIQTEKGYQNHWVNGQNESDFTKQPPGQGFSGDAVSPGSRAGKFIRNRFGLFTIAGLKDQR